MDTKKEINEEIDLNKDNFNVEEQSKDGTAERPKGFGVRHIQVGLWCSGLLVAYAGRVNLSVAIVAMVDNSANPDFEAYPWDESIKGLVLSSFFWGYSISQIPAGLLAHRFGPKILFLVAAIVCCVTTILIPLFASIGWEVLCTCRFVQGIAQGIMYPSVHTLISKWIHPSERGFLTTFTYSGTQAGTVIMLAVSGVIAASSTGWPGIFYISGGVQGLWVILWFFLGTNSPADYKGISETEKYYIESMPGNTQGRKSKLPWKAVFTSTPFLALLTVHCAQNWGFWTLLTEIPSYMNGALNYDIKSNALLSALPYLVMFILSLVMSPISDFLINRGTITRGQGRKIFNSIAHYVPMVTLIGLGFVTKENSGLAVFLLTLAVGFNAGTYIGFLINHLDLAPNFAGTLMGITNGLANIFSILGPIVVGFIVTDQTDQSLWRIIFFIASGFYLVGNTVFVIFGQGTIQPWNEPIENTKDFEKDNSTDTIDTIAGSVDAVDSKNK